MTEKEMEKKLARAKERRQQSIELAKAKANEQFVISVREAVNDGQSVQKIADMLGMSRIHLYTLARPFGGLR